MNSGLVVERKGKNSALKVTDPSGQQAGQQLLDSFVEKLALNLPKFMESSGKEKAKILLQVIGVGDQLAIMEQQEKELFDERRAICTDRGPEGKIREGTAVFPGDAERPGIPL